MISAVTFIFARNVMEASSMSFNMGFGTVAPKFVLPGLSTVLSTMSIIWTWGGKRLAKRFLRRTNTTPVEAANLLRRVIKVGATINLTGLFTSVLGAQFIIDSLVAIIVPAAAAVPAAVAPLAVNLCQMLLVLVQEYQGEWYRHRHFNH